MILHQRIVKPFKCLCFLTLAVSLSACGTKQTYSGLQQGARNDCATSSANSSDYNQCLERLDMSYEEYEQARRENEDENL